MRLLLCDLETGEFYNNPRHWVHDHHHATAFADMPCLLNACNQLTGKHLAIIAVDEEDRPRYAVPLWGAPEPKSA